ncbi:FecR family protein [Mucilaginibacter aquaedulcis]|uniref:FecR family protein n=1 Tax=Mucilaginibacter aquaedulcis TaxID=1187081 RepID=UPI0025B4BB8E|nr:FecR family protein [Mucilaginibacter aquaedulcis]MDN3547311.1 FecR family protein [Mucilaginibacter aquaedulcis]
MDSSSEKEKALALLQKYRAGQCTPEETARIKQWFDSFDDLSDKLSAEEAQNAADEAADQAIIKLFGQDGARQRDNRTFGMFNTVWRIAACLLIGCGIYFAVSYLNKAANKLNTYTNYNTQKGERKTIILPDSSVVNLNAASSIQIASDFGAKDRRVVLLGEAFFQVSKDKTRPFIIRTGKIQTRVVGTSFNINAYPDENLISVAVNTGKVQVEKEERNINTLLEKDLTHNHLLVYNSKTNAYRHTLTDVSLLSAWRVNKLIFNKAPITQIAHILERTYNISIQITGKPQKTGLYTVTFNNYSLDKILPLLTDLTGATYQFKDKQLILNIQNSK